MVRFRTTFVITSILLSFASYAIADFSGQVVGVTDGDSLKVMHDGRAESVRLIGIDCPEKGQAFGQRAKKATSDLAFGHTVTVRPIEKGRYGRTVAKVVLPNGNILNHELVKDGWCWWYREYAPQDTDLEASEQWARMKNKGLWIDKEPVPPWEYRKAKRSPKSVDFDSASSRKPSKRHTVIIGNRHNHLYHRPSCLGYGQIDQDTRVEFKTETEAKAAGYHRAWNCS